MTSVNGILKGYWYQEGYLRTASYEFSIKNLEKKCIHLTNDAVQKKDENYGKFERGNKISFDEFNSYISNNYSGKSLYEDIYPRIKEIATDTLKAAYGKIDPDKRLNCMEIYGLDFMIDENLKVWLIEVNTNPCLEFSNSLLARIISNLIENCFRVAIDPLFPPP